MLYGGLKAACSMADCSKMTALWQILVAIKGDHFMADLGCCQW
jgi:hypothetical protein